MNEQAAGTSRQQLIMAARKQGYQVSATQIARWHRAGLLPRPQQRARGQGLGTQSLYPAGTLERLLLLCEIRRHERRIPNMAWQLWWAGYPVSLALIRTSLHTTATRLSRTLQRFTTIMYDTPVPGQQMSDLSEPYLDFLEHTAARHLPYPPLRRARKRVGRAHFPTYIRILLDIVTGTFQSTPDDDPQERAFELRVLAKGFGLQLLSDAALQNADYLFNERTLALLQDASRWFRERSWETALAIIDDYELLRSRDELHTSLNALLFSDRHKQLQHLFPIGCTALSEVTAALTQADQMLLLVLWIALHADDPAWTVRQTFPIAMMIVPAIMTI